jgi:4-hydroxyphenylpyruvate dioxygenase
MPGQGELPLDDWADAIRRIGYQGWWSLEIFNDRFRAGSASGVAVDGYRSLRLLEGGIARPAQPIPNRPQPDLPPRVDPLRVEFIEFAASHEEAEDLAAMLRPLGFAPTARHRSKDVTRWQQGAANIVINCEPEGLAHSFDMVHGASVCAIGIAVASPDAALARADAMRIPRFEQAIAPDEWAIPSVRGVGGSLLYLVDDATSASMWEHEFPHRLEGEDTSGPPLRLDHIAQTMQYEEFLSWLLFYISLFDVNKTPQLEIADPMGLVQSQAVESRDGSVRASGHPAQLLRRRGSALGPRCRLGGEHGEARHSLRSRWRGGILPVLHPRLCPPGVFRTGRAARLQRLRRGQCPDPAGRTGAIQTTIHGLRERNPHEHP